MRYTLAELPFPLGPVRDFYAFEQHVRTARARRGLQVPSEWYTLPVFYFCAPPIYGHDDVIPTPAYTAELDYELEVAAIIGRAGVNIPVAEAESYIFGYTVMNDWSARDVQRVEMAVGLGPAKAKDFALSLGPIVVTPDELASYRSKKGYALRMSARRNGVVLSSGSWADIHWSFAEMIARASQANPLKPGDVIGSGTVGTGCILELGPEAAGGWLQPGDTVALDIEGIGTLRNVIGAKGD